MEHSSPYNEAILVVDDDPVSTELYATILRERTNAVVRICEDSREVPGILRREPISLVLLDLHMPHIRGDELLPDITAEFPGTAVIMITSEERIETAVSCIRQGAFDYLTKPVDANRLTTAVDHALTIRDLEQQVGILAAAPEQPPRLAHPEYFTDILSESPRMYRIFAYVEAVGPSPRPVLVSGESGTGKELIARAVHRASRREGRFVPVNIAGLDDAMVSDTLFGHLGGAYTGASGSREGLVERARGGTLFLDEVGDLEPSTQVKLLRLLQEQEYYPLGADQPRRADIRVVAATHNDLQTAQEEGRFRRDLYYRLSGHRVQLPALRDRPEDIALLFRRFVADAAESLGMKAPAIDAPVLGELAGYSFPGNVRELHSIAYDCVTRAGNGRITAECLDLSGVPRRRPEEQGRGYEPWRDLSGVTTLPTLQEVEDALFREALRRTGGNQSAAARILGVSQSTLSRRFGGQRASDSAEP